MGKALARCKRFLMRLQTAWSVVGITLVLLLLVEASFRVAFLVRDRLTAADSPDQRILTEGYAGATWLKQHYREIESLEERWRPYVLFRPNALDGKTITIGSDGLRATWQPPPASGQKTGRKPVKLLMLGGSSLWGFGVRDDQTIPSLLARKLFDRGIPVEVRNLSGLGYVSTQEVIAPVSRASGGLSARRGDFLRRGQRHDVCRSLG